MFVYIMIVAMFFALYFIVPQKSSAIPCVLYVLAIAVMSYFVQPGETDDLARYFYIISQIEKAGYEGFRQMLESNYFDFGSFPVCGYYFYFISILKNPHFLPFFTILICYGCIILVIQKASVKFKVDKFYTMLALIFAISTYWYYDVCSGTRNGIAFTVTVACAYYHLVERKNIPLCIIGYVLACGMHSSGIVLVGLVAIAWLSCNFGSRIVNAALILSLAGGSALLGIFGGMAKSDFMQSLLGKTENALDNLGITTQTNYFVNIATFAVCAIIMFYCLPYIKKYVTDINQRRFFRFSEVLMCFMLGTLLTSLLFLRLARWVLPIVAAVVYMVGMQLQKSRLDAGLIDISYDSKSPGMEKIRAMNKGIFSFFVFVYSVIHFVYDITGSSLIWLNLGI